MNKTALFAVVITFAALFTCGCGKTKAPKSDEIADNRFNDMMASVVETEEMILYSAESNYLYYYDKASDQSGVLCGKPECTHDSAERNSSCNGYFPKSVSRSCVSVSGDRIYMVVMEKSENADYALYSEGLDGYGREKIRAVPFPEKTAPSSFYVYRGMLYTVAVTNMPEAGVPQTQVRLIADDINSAKQTIALERTFEPYGIPLTFVRFIGDDVFFMISNSASCSVYKWNSITEELVTILDWETITGATGFWVTENGEIYISIAGGSAELKRLENGALVPVFELEDGSCGSLKPILSDGIVCCVGVDKDSGERKLWVVDFSGETLYKGIFPGSAAAADYGAALSDTGFGSIGGNREELFIPVLIEFYYEDDEGEEHGTSYHYLLRCKITENGLEEEILIKER